MPRKTGIFLAVIAAMFLTSCAERVRAIRDDYHRRVDAARNLDPRAVLAGRDAETVLTEALSRAGCSWKEKALFGTSGHELTMEGYAYDAAARRLTVDLAVTSEQGFGRLHRTLTNAEIDLAAVASTGAAPPDPFGNMPCWDVDIRCPGAGCIQLNQRLQVLKNGEVTEETARHFPAYHYWTLNFPREADAVDAFAALGVLAE